MPIHTLAKGIKAGEGTVFGALLDDAVNETATQIFDRQQAESNVATDCGEAGNALVDMRRQYGDAQTVAFCSIECDFIGVVEYAGKQCCQIFARVMTFEPCRLIRQYGVGRCTDAPEPFAAV